MKTNILHGMTILGLGALLFASTATTPARADDWHRDRDRGRVVIDLNFNHGRVNTDLVCYNGPDHRPAGNFWYWDRHDRCWRRDRCR